MILVAALLKHLVIHVVPVVLLVDVVTCVSFGLVEQTHVGSVGLDYHIVAQC